MSDLAPTPPDRIDWSLVLLSGLAGAGIVAAFWFALKHAGQAKRA